MSCLWTLYIYSSCIIIICLYYMHHKSEYMVLFYNKHKNIAKPSYESLVFHFIANNNY